MGQERDPSPVTRCLPASCLVPWPIKWKQPQPLASQGCGLKRVHTKMLCQVSKTLEGRKEPVERVQQTEDGYPSGQTGRLCLVLSSSCHRDRLLVFPGELYNLT